jgi:thiamine-phosphate diphosphorylase/hydroxyethylthiazole kinase
MITGTGCTLGTTVSAMAAVVPKGGDVLAAAVAGTALFGIAAEKAAARAEVRGPGTFVPAFLDELYLTRKATAQGDLSWLKMVKLTAVDASESSS